MDDDEDYDYDYREDDDDWHRHAGDDDYFDEEDEYDDHDYDYKKYNNRRNDRRKEKEPEPAGKERELLEAIEGTSFSKSRVSFLQHSKKVVNRIEELLSEDEEDEEEKGEEDGENQGDEASASSDNSDMMDENIDPVAFQMVSNTLERRMKSIQRGMNYAVSAKLLLESVSESVSSEDDNGSAPETIRKDLISLAAGTLYHSQLSALHLWQILLSIIPELKNDEEKLEPQTCALPGYYWQTIACPSRTIRRILGTNGIKYPPVILEAIDAECNKYDFSGPPATCSGTSDDDDDVSIPTTVTDDYYGYLVVTPRDSSANDVLTRMFEGWDTPVDEKTMQEFDHHEAESEKLQKVKEDLEKNMKDLAEEIGGADGSNDHNKKFGLDGELHAIKNDCYDIKAGKYIYQICIFGKASQKDHDKPKSHGTDLGKWSGIEYVQKTVDGEPTNDHQRILKWENGASCWNGPKRSVTAHVTCGSETKLLSAEEPDTCRYVVKMQSHIACDETFKTLHGL